MDVVLLADALQKDGAQWEAKVPRSSARRACLKASALVLVLSATVTACLLSPAIGELSLSLGRFAAKKPQETLRY